MWFLCVLLIRMSSTPAGTFCVYLYVTEALPPPSVSQSLSVKEKLNDSDPEWKHGEDDSPPALLQTPCRSNAAPTVKPG